MIFNQWLVKAFSNFRVGPLSHSRKMKINGINLHSTFPGEIEISKTCDLIGGMRRELRELTRIGNDSRKGRCLRTATSDRTPAASRGPEAREDGTQRFGDGRERAEISTEFHSNQPKFNDIQWSSKISGKKN
jgi:hypothetical protein